MATIKISDDRLNSFYNQNPNFDILKFDLNDETAVSQFKWQDLNQKTTLDLLKKYQQSISLHSAHAIAALTDTQFVQDFSKKFRELVDADGEEVGVDVEQVALEIHQDATAIKANVSHLVANLHSQVASPHTRAMGVNNVGSDIHKFEDFPSYQELFGSLNHYECEHCRSIFSAAAYFVDLMRICDRYITQPNKDNILELFQLKKRRPDLATKIELTCENTIHQIPDLQIVNERLADVVNKQLRFPSSEGSGVGEDPFFQLANQNYPFNLPFNLPLTQIRTYLAQLKTSLFDIYNIFGVDEKEVAREYLELSHQEYQLITTSSAQDFQALGKSYGVDNLTDSEINKLKNVDNFLARTGLTLDELNQLLYQNLSKAEIEAGMCDQFFINRGLGNSDYLQISSDFSEIINLNNDTLDRINRFVRLAKKLNWSFADLDWVLRAISNDNPKIDDDSDTIIKIAKIKQIAEKYKLKLDVVCSFFYNLKNVGDNNPYQAFTDNETGTNASRITAGLRTNLNDLKALRIAFFSNSKNPEEIELTVEKLSVFYRHVKLATIAKLPIEQYLILLRLINKQIQVFAVEDVTEILDMVEWLRKSGFHVYELDYILNGTESKYVGKWDKEEDIQGFLEHLWTINNNPQQEKEKQELTEYLDTYPENLTPLFKGLMDLFTKTITLSDDDLNDIKAFLEEHYTIEDTRAFIETLGGKYTKQIEKDKEELIKHLNTYPESSTGIVEKLMELIKQTVTLPDDNDATLNAIKDFLEKPHDQEESQDFLRSFLSTINNAPQSKKETEELIEYLEAFLFYPTFIAEQLTEYLSDRQTTLSDGILSDIKAFLEKPFKAEEADTFLGLIYERINRQSRKEGDLFYYLNSFPELSTYTLNKIKGVVTPTIALPNGVLSDIKSFLEKPYTQPDVSRFLDSLEVKADIPSFLDYLAEKFNKQLEKEKTDLSEHLATFLGSSTDIVEALMELVTKTIALPDGVPNYTKAFLEKPQDPQNNPNSDYIKQVLSSVSKWLVITKKFQLNQTEIDSIGNYPNEYRFTEDFTQIRIDNLKIIHTFKQLTKAFNDTQNELIQHLPERTYEKLAKITGWEEAQMDELWRDFSSITDIVTYSEVMAYKQVFDLNKSLGANISFWKKVLSLADKTAEAESDWRIYKEVAQSILHLVKAKYKDDEWEKVSEKFDSQLNELKRNVLGDFALWKLNQQDDSIKNLRNLSEYLLIDVETTGCASVSYIKQAILSLQMYLQRCRMHLEPGVTQVNIPEAWWQWIMNYRIWEANRKVFLYPENYIDPSLRHTKTSLFQELESELLQSDITQDSVEQAYQNYFNKFAELAQLKPAASYRCTVKKANSTESQDTLFLFGRTASEPYTYYYQECINPTVNKPTWTAWNKVDLTINSDYINATYAFNKLFIFWVEISKTKKTIGQEDGKTIKKNETLATIKYSFHKVGKQWMQPQTLAKDIVIEDYDESNSDGTLWHKVSALPIKGNDSEEKILTLFGNFQIYSSPHGFGSIADVQTTLTINLLPENIGVFLRNQPSDGVQSIIFNSQLQVIATTNLLYDNYNDDSKDSLLWSRMVGYWPMNDGTGIVIKDQIGDHNGTWRSAHGGGTPTWKTVTDFPGADSRSVLEFDGEGDLISFDSSNVPVANEPYTIAAWIKPYDMEIGGIIGWGNYGTTNEVNALALFGTNFSNQFIRHYWWDNDLDFSVDITGQWHHIVATFDGRTRKIFLDGQEVANDQPSGHNVTRTDTLTIGYAFGQPNTHFKGQIAEVSIWNVALSAEQIQFASTPLIPLITNNISTPHSYTKTIKNQPGWFTFENGDEAFLVIPQENDFKQISNSLKVTQISANDNLILSYDHADDTSDITPLSELKFAFTRLTTSTIRQLSQKMLIGGLDHLLTLDSQLTPELNFTRFSSTENVIAPNSKQLDFDGPYGIYFWEIFFHIPFLVANTLNANQKFEEAQKWYNYIFNPTTQEKGPVGYWPMNDGKGTIIKDKSHYDNKGAFQGNPQWKKVNDFPGADSRDVLEFDGEHDYISFDNSNVPLKNQTYTITAWIKPYEMGNRGIVGWGNYGVKNKVNALRLLDENGIGIRHEWWDHDLDHSVNLTGAWHHVAATFDGTTRKVFLDGKEVAKDQPSGHNVTEKNNLTIGLWNDSQANKYFKGQIAEVSIWNIALSAEQIKNLSGNNTAEQMKNFCENNTNDRFWRYLPFRGHTLEKLKGILTDEQAIQAYNDNPVDPHAIARLRIGAYEKAIVMKYIDNLLDWGDKLFAQDTWESITQATMLYLLAYDLLGQKPEDLGKIKSSNPETFNDIKEQYDGRNIPQFLIDLEHHVGDSQSLTLNHLPFNDINAYFCVSENEQFTAYWDRVQDRLYKIRHCENLEGVVRQLALFEPPIDPNQLVRAVAGGNTPMSVVSGLTAEVPNYRFDYMLERAKNITSTLIQLGSSLLSALEKKDAEQIALLRATQEPAILRLIQTTKEKQIEEAQASLESLNKSLNAANNRVTHYQGLIDGGLSSHEKDNERLMESAIAFEATAAISHTISSPVYSVPTIFGFSDGGFKPADIIRAIGEAAQSTAGVLNQSSQLTATMAQFDRREEDWQLQLQIAQDEVSQITQQIAASNINIEIATSELTSHQKSIEQADEIENFFKNKFTTTDLYQWMVSRLSTLYFQTFKIAQDMALAAQKAYQYELNQDQTYIQFDYWDSLHKGLLAGEGLMLGLNQLEKAYIEGNVRRLEIEKTISLLQLNPQAFQKLKDTGKCEFTLSEKLFDFDFPGHYCRQIKTIAVSIPAVVGPYQNIKATLTQTSNKTLLKPNVKAVEYLLTVGENPQYDSILRSNWRRNQKIAISRGAMDNGLFELNFYWDTRYLPFEGTGAVSTWELSLPKATNRIDFDTISDVIITLSYTALDGGDKFRQDITNLEPFKQYSEAYYFNLKQSFPGEWHTFLNSNQETNSPKLNFHISEDIIPPNVENAKLTQILFKLDALDQSSNLSGTFEIVNEQPLEISLQDNNIASLEVNLSPEQFAGHWSLSFESINPENINNIELILIFTGELTGWSFD